MIAEINWQMGTIGEWVSGIGAAAAVAIAWFSIRNERIAHHEATNELARQRRLDQEREERAAQIEADTVGFDYTLWFGSTDLLGRFEAQTLKNSSQGVTFYKVEIRAVDRSTKSIRYRAELPGSLMPQQDLAEILWRSNAAHDDSIAQHVLNQFGQGPAEIRERLGIEVPFGAESPIDLEVHYSDAAGRRWRKTRTEPAARIDEVQES